MRSFIQRAMSAALILAASLTLSIGVSPAAHAGSPGHGGGSGCARVGPQVCP